MALKRVALAVPGYERGGGVPTVADFLREALRRDAGYEVELFSLSTSWQDPESTRFSRPWEWLSQPTIGETFLPDGTRIKRIGARWAEWELQRYKARRPLTVALAGFDLIQVVAGSGVWAAGCLAAGPPVFLQVATTLSAERQTSMSDSGWKALLRRFATRLAQPLEQRGLCETAGVFVENHWMADYVGKLRGDGGVHFAPPGVDTGFFKPTTGTVRKHILFAGRMDDPRKNVALLLKAYAICVSQLGKAPPLVLAGYRGLTPAQQDLLRQLGLSKRVEIRERPSREELRVLYQEALLLVLSSNEEGLGMVILEAMACGTPVVSTDCGGPRTIVRPEKNGLLVTVGDTDGLAAALTRVLTNPVWMESLGAEARRTTEEGFSISACGRRFTRVYESYSAAGKDGLC